MNLVVQNENLPDHHTLLPQSYQYQARISLSVAHPPVTFSLSCFSLALASLCTRFPSLFAAVEEDSWDEPIVDEEPALDILGTCFFLMKT